MDKDKEICQRAAEVFAGRDLHKMSGRERDLVKLLEENGYLIPYKPATGFAGVASNKA